jgi:molybdopterin-containing oxidoreductase family membrane subunit
MITRKKLVKDNVIHLFAKISGWMIITYITAKTIDTIYWASVTAPGMGFKLTDFYNGSTYSIALLFIEIIICGFIPGLILITRRGRENPFLLMTAIILGVIGVSLNRWVMVLQVMAIPVFSFNEWYTYMPSWQEVATTVLPVAYGLIVISLAYRYLPVFPQEKELNPID